MPTIPHSTMGLADKFKFGKYKGFTLQWVIDNDRGYVTWLLEMTDKLHMDNEAYTYYK